MCFRYGEAVSGGETVTISHSPDTSGFRKPRYTWLVILFNFNVDFILFIILEIFFPIKLILPSFLGKLSLLLHQSYMAISS